MQLSKSPVSTPPAERDHRPVVLIVDDHQNVTRSLSRIVDHHGFAAAPVHTGQAAINYATIHPVSAVILDIHLPDISGLIVSQRLRDRLGPKTPIIILSGDGSMETLNSLPHVGATYFYRKPIQSAQLIEHLRSLLHGTTAGEGQR